MRDHIYRAQVALVCKLLFINNRAIPPHLFHSFEGPYGKKNPHQVVYQCFNGSTNFCSRMMYEYLTFPF